MARGGRPRRRPSTRKGGSTRFHRFTVSRSSKRGEKGDTQRAHALSCALRGMLGAPVARGAGREKRGLLKPILVVALCAFFGAWFYELLEFSSETGVHHRSQGHDAQHAAPGPEAHAPTPAVATPRTTPEVAQTPVAASFDPISPSLWYFRRDVAEYLQNSVTINRTIPAPLPPIAKACPDGTNILSPVHVSAMSAL